MNENKTNELYIQLHACLDIVLTIISFITAYFIKIYLLPEPLKGLSITPNYYVVLLLIIIIWYLSFKISNVYNSFFKMDAAELIWNVFKAITGGMIILISFLYIFNIIKHISRILLGIFYINNIILLIINKIILYNSFVKHRRSYKDSHNILIVGSKLRAKEAINLISLSPYDYNIIGCLDVNKSYIGKKITDNIKVIGTMDDLKDVITNNVVDEVIFAMPLREIDSVDVYMLLIEMVGVKIRIFPEWHIHSLQYKPGIARIKFENFAGMPSMVLIATSMQHYDLFIKAVFDYLISAIAFFCSLPLLSLIALAIKIISKGPILFKQVRLGRNGRKFIVYKFRTMIQDAEKKLEELNTLNEADGPAFKIKKDPRIIPYLGTFLRKTSLDELPQLINVLKGEMSLIGPRPPLPHEVDKYEVWQRRRMSMKPGLTCLWQTAPRRNDLSFYQWMALDLEYIDKWSLKLDLQIFIKTFITVLRGGGR